MKFGLMLPNKGRPYGDADVLIELANLADQSGWQGFFLWDHIGGGDDMVNKDFKAFGDETGPRTRAEMLDESLEIIAGLQSGQPLSFAGKHYKKYGVTDGKDPAKDRSIVKEYEKVGVTWWINELPNQPGLREAAAKIGTQIRAEPGIETAVKLIEQTFG